MCVPQNGYLKQLVEIYGAEVVVALAPKVLGYPALNVVTYAAANELAAALSTLGGAI